MKDICGKGECTGCAACYNICPRGAITMDYNEAQELVPIIDESKCINCKMCEKICPNNSEINYNKPIDVYAAWNRNQEEQNSSTSGGIAAYFYQQIIKENGVGVGCDFNKDMELIHSISENFEDCKKFKQSKYVQSYIGLIYQKIESLLNDGKKVLFIGTPCQVQGLKSYLRHEYENLILVDIICHGVPSNKFLKDHIKMIEKKKKEIINRVTFRDKQKYVLKLYNEEQIIYRKSILRDEFLMGFLNNVLERESCFQCKYARTDRVSDITIGDFWGIGKTVPFNKPDNTKVSLILVNTKKGDNFIQNAKEGLHLEKRELEEAVQGNRMLRQPPKKHKNYYEFRELYSKYGYKKAIRKCLKKEIREGRIKDLKQKIKRNIKIGSVAKIYHLCYIFVTFIDKKFHKIYDFVVKSYIKELFLMQTTKWKIVAFITILLCFFLFSTTVFATEDTDVTSYFKDENLKNAILEIIRDVEENESKNNITISDIDTITSDELPSGKQLNLAGKDITDLSGLELFADKGLEWIYLDWNNISDMSVLSSFTTLTKISASGNQVSDISFLQNLQNIQNVNFSNNNISNINVLSNLTNIKYLYLDNNQIQDITAIGNLSNLVELSIAGNQITNIDLLTKLTAIENIDASRNSITSIANFNNNTTIEKLNLNYNQLQSLNGIEKLINLEVLSASNNKIEDISALGNLSKLYNLNLNKNEINSIGVLENNNIIEYLYLDANHIINTDPLENMTNLKKVTIYNQTYTVEVTQDYNSEQLKVNLTSIFRNLMNPNSKIYNSEVYYEMQPADITYWITEDLTYFLVNISDLEKQDLSFTMKDDNNTYITLYLQYRVQEDDNTENVTDPGEADGEENLSDVYTVENGYVKEVQVNTTLEKFLNNLNQTSGARVTHNNVALTNNDIIGTGDVLTVGGKTYIIIVKADSSGDGLANIMDLMRVKRHILGTRTLSTVEQLASDLNSDGDINIMDVMKLINIIIN